MRREPYMMGDPKRQERGAKSKVVPNKGEQSQNWLPQRCLLGGPKEGENGTSPLLSRGSPTKGNENHKWLTHPCLLGVPNAKRRDQPRK